MHSHVVAGFSPTIRKAKDKGLKPVESTDLLTDFAGSPPTPALRAGGGRRRHPSPLVGGGAHRRCDGDGGMYEQTLFTRG